MKPYTSLLLAATLAITLASCGKDEMATPDVPPEGPPVTVPESGNNTSKIQGTWSLAGMYLAATSTVTADNTKTITYTEYNTTKNGGTIVIDATKMVTTGLTYAIESVSKAKYYEDGLLTDEWDMPFIMTLPPLDLNSPYKQINEESIFYESGFIGSTDESGTPQKSDASGSRISWLGDTLVLTSYPYKVTTVVQSGLTITNVSEGKSMIKMVKKK